MINSNDLAFPRAAFYHEHIAIVPPEKGLTKREHFASLLMQGYLANEKNSYARIDVLAELSINAADELINKLNK
jgi:hypothetical protein